MNVTTAISRIKAAGHDISDEYSSERCLEFLNKAVQQVSALLIGNRYPALVKEMLVHSGDRLPKNYCRAAGTYPLRMTDGKAEIIDDGLQSVRFRYFATPDALTESSKELPYEHDGINEVIVATAVLLALNENEYDISQDAKLMEALQASMAAAMQ